MNAEPHSLFAVAWTRTLTGEAGYVKSADKQTIQLTPNLLDAALYEQADADQIVTRLKVFVATHAYTVGVTTCD